MAIVQFDNVSRIYTSGDHELRALDQVNFTLDEGKFVVILGPSGAGKSTLLNLLGFDPVNLRRFAPCRLDGCAEEQEDRYGRSAQKFGIRGCYGKDHG